MSESAATAWIVERLEVENTKMEEEMGAMETCEEDSAGGNSGATPLIQKKLNKLLLTFVRSLSSISLTGCSRRRNKQTDDQ